MIGASRSVFVDTSAWHALIDERDGRHADAVLMREQFNRSGLLLATSNFVLAESHALILRRRGREPAVEYLRWMRESDVSVDRITEEDEERAVEIIEQYADKAFSYTDASSFAVMRRLRIETAFSFDRHFAQFGLTTLGVDA